MNNRKIKNCPLQKIERIVKIYFINRLTRNGVFMIGVFDEEGKFLL